MRAKAFMASFKFDRKWQLLCGWFGFVATDLVFFNIAVKKRLLTNLSRLCGKMAQGFKKVFAFALYLNLSYLAKFNLLQALFKIYMKIW